LRVDIKVDYPKADVHVLPLMAGTACSPTSPIAVLGKRASTPKVRCQAPPRTGVHGHDQSFARSDRAAAQDRLLSIRLGG
jgi:hypothetical protein